MRHTFLGFAIAALAGIGPAGAAPASGPPGVVASLISGAPAASPAVGRAQVEPTGEVHWTRIGRAPVGGDAAGGGPFQVVGFDRGYVVVDGSNKIRFSPDGVAWTSIQLSHAAGVPLGVRVAASKPQRVVVGGSYTPCTKSAWSANCWGSCRARPASWMTTDGLHWSVARAWTGRIGPIGKDGSDFTAIWPVRGGGWDAAQLFSGSDELDDLDPTGPAIWHSNGGRTWTLVRRGPPQPGASCGDWWREDLTGFGGSGGTRVIPYSCVDGVVMKTSADGRYYRRTSGPPQVEGQWVGDGIGSKGTRPWVFVGGHETASAERHAIAWATRDLASWTVTSLPVPDGVTRSYAGTLGRWRDGYVAAGTGAASVGVSTLTWLSDDGEAWRLADRQAIPGLIISDIARGPAGTLAFGQVSATGDRYRMLVWRLDAAAP